MSEKKPGGSSRRRGREVALQVLYAIDIDRDRPRREPSEADARGDDDAPARPEADPAPASQTDAIFDAVTENFEVPPGARRFAQDLVYRVRSHLPELDAAIADQAKNWRVSRMAVVDRNILRLGTYELVHTETPAAVILNEAVDLARRFSNDPSPAFVNGILDAVARSVREWEP